MQLYNILFFFLHFLSFLFSPWGNWAQCLNGLIVSLPCHVFQIAAVLHSRRSWAVVSAIVCGKMLRYFSSITESTTTIIISTSRNLCRTCPAFSWICRPGTMTQPKDLSIALRGALLPFRRGVVSKMWLLSEFLTKVWRVLHGRLYA